MDKGAEGDGIVVTDAIDEREARFPFKNLIGTEYTKWEAGKGYQEVPSLQVADEQRRADCLDGHNREAKRRHH